MYKRDVNRRHKVAFVVAIDQSSSMTQEIVVNSAVMSKANFVSLVVGELIEELILRSRYDNHCRDYYDIAVVGYSANEVRPLIGQALEFISVADLSQRRVEREVVTFHNTLINGEEVAVPHGYPKWIEPVAGGSTPMCKMLQCVAELLEGWCEDARNRDSFPPVFVNISDGMSSDSTEEELLEAAERIKHISTKDGNTLFINVNISADGDNASLVYPSITDIDCCNQHAVLLAKLSSRIPEALEHSIQTRRSLLSPPPYIAMGYNTSPSEFIAMFNIGSRSDSIRQEQRRLESMAAL